MKSEFLPISVLVLFLAQGCGADVATEDSELTGEATQALHHEHELRRFVEGYKIRYKNYKTTCQTELGSTLHVEHFSRPCALCSYHFYSAVDLQPGESHESCNDARRTKVVVSAPMPDECYDYELEAWNCS